VFEIIKKSAASDFNKNTPNFLRDTDKLTVLLTTVSFAGIISTLFIMLWVALATDMKSYSVLEKILSGSWL
jgi:hypothetical protein